MLRIVILGFPRTATTAVYVRLRNEIKDHIAIFEPFNPDRVIAELNGGVHGHDVLGNIDSDFKRLSHNLKLLIASNSLWLHDWLVHRVPRAPWCGWWWSDILKQLHELDSPVLVKDVYVWWYLPELAYKYRDTLFIVMCREKNAVLKALKEWHVGHNLPSRITLVVSKLIKRLIKRKTLNKEKVKQGLDFLIYGRPLVTPAEGISICFSKLFNMKSPRSRYWKDLKSRLETIYERYLIHVKSIVQHNVLHIEFVDQLSNIDFEKLLSVVRQWLRK